VAAKKKGEGRVEKDLPDCRCYMRVLSVENAPDYWGVYDYTDQNLQQGYVLSGLGNDLWYDGSSYIPFPSTFMELDLPSAGSHQILVWPGNNSVTNDFTIHVEVDCRYGGLDGGLGGRTYNFSFVYGDGEDVFGLFRGFHLNNLKCEYDTVDDVKK